MSHFEVGLRATSLGFQRVCILPTWQETLLHFGAVDCAIARHLLVRCGWRAPPENDAHGVTAAVGLENNSSLGGYGAIEGD